MYLALTQPDHSRVQPTDKIVDPLTLLRLWYAGQEDRGLTGCAQLRQVVQHVHSVSQLLRDGLHQHHGPVTETEMLPPHTFAPVASAKARSRSNSCPSRRRSHTSHHTRCPAGGNSYGGSVHNASIVASRIDWIGSTSVRFVTVASPAVST